jgi:hypothetical protein
LNVDGIWDFITWLLLRDRLLGLIFRLGERVGRLVAIVVVAEEVIVVTETEMVMVEGVVIVVTEMEMEMVMVEEVVEEVVVHHPIRTTTIHIIKTAHRSIKQTHITTATHLEVVQVVGTVGGVTVALEDI